MSVSFVFYEGQVILAEHSALFEIIAPLPAEIEAGQKTLLVVTTTNRSTDIGL